MLIKNIWIGQNERALLLRHNDFVRVLGPGSHWLWLGSDKRVERFNLAQPEFRHALAPYLMAHEPQVVAQHFVSVKLSETQLGLRYENDILVQLLPPATQTLYWQGANKIRVDVIDIAEQAEVPQSLVQRLTQNQLRARAVDGVQQGVLQVQVPTNSVGLLGVDGKPAQLLPSGNYAHWKYNRSLTLELVDLRLQSLEVTGQEILTRDKVSLRLNLVATWRYGDVLVAFTQLNRPVDHLYRELQFGLREAVGTRTLDELLENKTVLDELVGTYVRAKLQPYGITLASVGVKDIVLPGDMKTILAKVVEAEKSAQANVIRRREETAATRSLLNTAKVMEDNPTALRLKEMETLERVAERIDKISVFGGLDQVLNGLVKLR